MACPESHSWVHGAAETEHPSFRPQPFPVLNHTDPADILLDTSSLQFRLYSTDYEGREEPFLCPCQIAKTPVSRLTIEMPPGADGGWNPRDANEDLYE